MPVRSVELLSCLTRRVTEAESSSSVEKRTPRMLIFNFGNRSKSRGSYRGFRADGVAPPSRICPTIHGHPYHGGAERCYAKSKHLFPASLVCSRASYASVFANIGGSRPQLQSYHSVPCLSWSHLHNRTRKSSFVSRSAGPSWIFSVSGKFASPLTGLTFQFRLEILDPGFVNSNHLLQKFVGVFPRNVSILMYVRWSPLVTVPETRTAAISTLCLFHMHTPPETNYTALASRSSPVQLLKWQDRWCHYLRSVANVCISFEITHVFKRVVIKHIVLISRAYQC